MSHQTGKELTDLRLCPRFFGRWNWYHEILEFVVDIVSRVLLGIQSNLFHYTHFNFRPFVALVSTSFLTFFLFGLTTCSVSPPSPVLDSIISFKSVW